MSNTGEDDGGFSEAISAHIDTCGSCAALEKTRKRGAPTKQYQIDRLQEDCFQAEQADKQAAHEARLDDEADRTNDDSCADKFDLDPPHQLGCVCADCSGAELTADND